MADRQQLARAAEEDLLVRDEPGQPDRVDRRVRTDARSRRGGGPGRGVHLALVVQLDDLTTRELRRGLLGEPHHQRGAEREVGCIEDRDLDVADALEIPAARADDARHPRLGGRSDVRDDRVGTGEVDHDIGVVERCNELVAVRFERGAEHRADLPAAAVEEDPHAAWGRSGVIRPSASRNRS